MQDYWDTVLYFTYGNCSQITIQTMSDYYQNLFSTPYQLPDNPDPLMATQMPFSAMWTIIFNDAQNNDITSTQSLIEMFLTVINCSGCTVHYLNWQPLYTNYDNVIDWVTAYKNDI